MPLTNEQRDKLRLIDEEELKVLESYLNAIEQGQETKSFADLKLDAQLDKAYPLIEAEVREKTLKEVGLRLYHSLPTGEITAWDYVKWSKNVIEKLQNGELP